MGYFAFGWPRCYSPESSPPGECLKLLPDPSSVFLLSLSAKALHLWSASAHRVLLSTLASPPAPSSSFTHIAWRREIHGLSATSAARLLAAVSSGSLLFISLRTAALGRGEGDHQPPHIEFDASGDLVRNGTEGLLDFKLKSKPNGAASVLEEMASPMHLEKMTMAVERTVKVVMGDDEIVAVEAGGDVVFAGTKEGYLLGIAWDGEVLWKVQVMDLLRRDNTLVKMGVHIDETGDYTDGSVTCIEHSFELSSIGVVLGCGMAFIMGCAENGKSPPSVEEGRWLRTSGAVSIALQDTRMLATVGLRDGDVEQYYVGVPAGDKCSVLRKLSLSSWYFEPDDVGPANVLKWTPDGAALAVGWEKRGLAVWSVSGCRLMWTLPQVGGALPTPSPSSKTGEARVSFSHPMENGVRSIAWGIGGFFLWAAPRRYNYPNLSEDITKIQAYQFMEFDFFKSSVIGGSVVQNEASRLSLIGQDRLLYLSGNERMAQVPSSLESLEWQQIQIPHDYIWRNWPPVHLAINDESTFAAVTGTTGVGICSLRTRRWQFFGDVTSHQPIRACALGWYQKWLIVGNEILSNEGSSGPPETSYEILFYPRVPADSSMAHARKGLHSRPVLLDIRADGYVMVVCEDSSIVMHRLTVVESFRGVQSINVAEVYRLVLPRRNETGRNSSKTYTSSSRFSPGGGVTVARIFPPLDHGIESARQALLQPDTNIEQTSAVNAAMPTQIMLLRNTGSLVLLDCRTMMSTPLLRFVEHFWYTHTSGSPFENIQHRPLWWAYGDEGLHVCFRSGMKSLLDSGGTGVIEDPTVSVEQWFELDPEVYPMGLMPQFGMVLGASQGLAAHAFTGQHRESPCHVIKVKRQPILHTILRHLLLQERDDRLPLSVAIGCCRHPQFIESLEWLLYEAVLEHDHANSVERIEKTSFGFDFLLFPRVIRLLRYFGEYEDVVVRCARKMDSKRWPLLFSQAGEPAALLEQCYNSGRLTTAACLLVILQEMWGFMSSTPHSLRLLETALERGNISLAADLSRFLSKAASAGMLEDNDAMGLPENISWMHELDIENRLYPVDARVSRRARQLLAEHDFRQLIALSVRMRFPIAEWLRREHKGVPVVTNFRTFLLGLHRQFQWPEPRPRDILRAFRIFFKSSEGGEKTRGVTLGASPINSGHEDDFGLPLPPPPKSFESDRLSTLRAHARQLCREELNYLRKVSQLAGTLDLTLAVATLLLDVQVITNVVFERDTNRWKEYVGALQSFDVPGYTLLAEELVTIGDPSNKLEPPADVEQSEGLLLH